MLVIGRRLERHATDWKLPNESFGFINGKAVIMSVATIFGITGLISQEFITR